MAKAREKAEKEIFKAGKKLERTPPERSEEKRKKEEGNWIEELKEDLKMEWREGIDNQGTRERNKKKTRKNEKTMETRRR